MGDIWDLCPAICTNQTYVIFSYVGIIFGLLAVLMVFVLLKKLIRKSIGVTLGAIFFIIFFMYGIQIEYERCGSGCAKNGTYYQYRLLPKYLIPFASHEL